MSQSYALNSVEFEAQNALFEADLVAEQKYRLASVAAYKAALAESEARGARRLAAHFNEASAKRRAR